MHVQFEFKDAVTPEGAPAVEFKITNLEELRAEDFEKDLTPVGWITEIINVLMQTGQMNELIEAYKIDLAAKKAEERVAQAVQDNLET